MIVDREEKQRIPYLDVANQKAIDIADIESVMGLLPVTIGGGTDVDARTWPCTPASPSGRAIGCFGIPIASSSCSANGFRRGGFAVRKEGREGEGECRRVDRSACTRLPRKPFHLANSFDTSQLWIARNQASRTRFTAYFLLVFLFMFLDGRGFFQEPSPASPVPSIRAPQN